MNTYVVCMGIKLARIIVDANTGFAPSVDNNAPVLLFLSLFKPASNLLGLGLHLHCLTDLVQGLRIDYAELKKQSVIVQCLGIPWCNF